MNEKVLYCTHEVYSTIVLAQDNNISKQLSKATILLVKNHEYKFIAKQQLRVDSKLYTANYVIVYIDKYNPNANYIINMNKIPDDFLVDEKQLLLSMIYGSCLYLNDNMKNIPTYIAVGKKSSKTSGECGVIAFITSTYKIDNSINCSIAGDLLYQDYMGWRTTPVGDNNDFPSATMFYKFVERIGGIIKKRVNIGVVFEYLVRMDSEWYVDACQFNNPSLDKKRLDHENYINQ